SAGRAARVREPLRAPRRADLHAGPRTRRALHLHLSQLDLRPRRQPDQRRLRSEEHTSELQSPCNLVCRLLLEKKKKKKKNKKNRKKKKKYKKHNNIKYKNNVIN